MSTAKMWSKSKPDVEFQYGGRLGKFNGMSSQSHLPHCRVLPPGEFNYMIPELRVTLQGAATGQIQWHVFPEPFGEFTVMIPEPHATLQGVMLPSAILKIVFRHILFFVFNAVWALMSGGFRIVSDALVLVVMRSSPRRPHYALHPDCISVRLFCAHS